MCEKSAMEPGTRKKFGAPCLNLRSFGSNCTVLKKVLATLWLFGTPQWFGARGVPLPLFPPTTPLMQSACRYQNESRRKTNFSFINTFFIVRRPNTVFFAVKLHYRQLIAEHDLWQPSLNSFKNQTMSNELLPNTWISQDCRCKSKNSCYAIWCCRQGCQDYYYTLNMHPPKTTTTTRAPPIPRNASAQSVIALATEAMPKTEENDILCKYILYRKKLLLTFLRFLVQRSFWEISGWLVFLQSDRSFQTTTFFASKDEVCEGSMVAMVFRKNASCVDNENNRIYRHIYYISVGNFPASARNHY